MQRVSYFVFTILLLGIFAAVCPPKHADAAQASEGVYVYDDADLFTYDEEQKLAAELEKQGKRAGVGIYVLTSDNSGYGASDRYIEDFYDEGYDSGQIERNAVLLHIDMEERYVNVQAYGKAQRRVSDRVADQIIDACYNLLRRGDYYAAGMTFAGQVYKYVVPFYMRAWVQLLAAMAIGGVSVGVMAAGSGGKMTADGSTYIDLKRSGIRARRDDYIRTTVTRRRRPTESSGGRGGGGGSHHSSGGHSHSSAGRHF